MFRALLLLCLIVPPLTAQAGYLQADSALATNQPWRATQLLQPLLADPATRTSDVVLLAARAAAAWEGWPTVRRLLEGQPWLDTRFDRLGRRLLAEGALAEDRNPQALVHALAAATSDSARAPDEQAQRLLLLARAYDRLDQLDSAAAAYRRAAVLLPDLGDWVTLRAAGVTADSTTRATLYASISSPAAVPRIPWTEALARDRANDIEGAAVRYDRLGAHVAAIRVRWRAAITDSARRELGHDLATVMAGSSTVAEARDALDLIAHVTPPLSRDDRLIIARRAAAINRPQDAIDIYAPASRALLLPDADRIIYGTALGAVSRWTEAAAVFAGVTDRAFAGRAAYYHARALMRDGEQELAIPALREVVKDFPRDTVAASTSLHLLGDLAIDAGRLDSARADYLALATRYPTSALRAHAIFLAAVIAWGTGKPGAAASELTQALDAHRLTGEVDASRYWIGRSQLATGDTAAARAAWRTLLDRGPDNYYAVRAAARLDTIAWPTMAPQPLLPPDSLKVVFNRAQRLDALRLSAEAKFERDRVIGMARGPDAARVAEVLLARGFASRAALLANRAVTAGAPRDGTIWQLLYPLPFAGTLREIAAREQVDPLLVASVIRQESGFEPHATSRTNARGLMQVEPVTGQELAQTLGVPDFDPALLWVAPVNLVLGIHHFAAALARYPDVERALAAYNAGTSRIDRWSTSPLDGHERTAARARDPLDDVDLFVERIPYVETRDYVRAIIRNREVYRMIYGK